MKTYKNNRPESIYHGNALKEVVKDYIENGGSECPMCSSKDLENPMGNVYEGYDHMECYECGFKWTVLYKPLEITSIQTKKRLITPTKIMKIISCKSPIRNFYIIEGVEIKST